MTDHPNQTAGTADRIDFTTFERAVDAARCGRRARCDSARTALTSVLQDPQSVHDDGLIRRAVARYIDAGAAFRDAQRGQCHWFNRPPVASDPASQPPGPESPDLSPLIRPPRPFAVPVAVPVNPAHQSHLFPNSDSDRTRS